jgi:tetratricopeptide (TPR) repeat protein
MEESYTALLRNEPNNVGLYTQRADLRARHLHKWSEAGEDLAKAIELNPRDAQTWHRRTMLLGKLQQKDLLAEHLAKMLAKVQGNSIPLGPAVMQSLTTFPTERPELIQGCAILAGKLPYNSCWLAFVRYRAGKYEEAESLFSTAAALSPRALTTGEGGWVYEPPIFLAFHAMIKAKLNDRKAATELLSKAREALKKAVLDSHGTENGDYGEHWWDRLSAESLLAEAETLITGAKP